MACEKEFEDLRIRYEEMARSHLSNKTLDHITRSQHLSVNISQLILNTHEAVSGASKNVAELDAIKELNRYASQDANSRPNLI